MNLAHDSLHDIEQMLRDMKFLITSDNDTAAKALTELGVTKAFLLCGSSSDPRPLQFQGHEVQR